MSILHPIILVSFPGIGEEIIDNVIQNSSYFSSDNLHSNFVKHIRISDTGELSCDNNVIQLPLSKDKDKEDNFIETFNIKEDLLAFFNSVTSKIYNGNNRNRALNENFQFDEYGPKIIFLTNLASPFLLPVYFSIVRSRSYLTHKMTSISLLLTTQNNIKENRKESLMRKVSFFKEIEAFHKTRTQWDIDNIWISDMTNDQGYVLADSKSLYQSISYFLDILYFNDNIWSSFNAESVQGRSCLYSSFGVSTLIFSSEKVKEYMNLFIKHSEMDILVNSFNTKFAKSIIKSSLGTFFRKERWTDIHEDINKLDNGESIYQPFNFNYEKGLTNEDEITSKYILQKIDSPRLLSNEITSQLLISLTEKQNNFLDTVESNYEPSLFRAKQRELERLKNSIISQIKNILDKDHRKTSSLEGINYAILFCSFLNKKEDKVVDLMSDSTHIEYENLYTIQDKIRELFLGDELRDLEKKEKVAIDDFTDKKNLIDKYNFEISSNIEAVEKLEKDSAKFIEITEDNKVKQQAIINLNQDLIIHKKDIEDFSELSNQIRLNFDKDEFRRQLREKRILQYEVDDELLKESIQNNDNELTGKYEIKNIQLVERKKVLFRDIYVIPISVLSIFILINVLLIYKVGWFYDFFSFFLTFKYRLLISVLIPFVFLLKGAYKLFSIHQEIKSTIISIKKYQSNKKDLFIKLVKNFDNKTKYIFYFSKNIYAYNMLEETIKSTESKISELEEYKLNLKETTDNLKKRINDYKFTSSSFDFCLLKSHEVDEICKNEKLSLINSNNDFNLSSFFSDYTLNRGNLLFNNLVSKEVDKIYERKINNISVRDLLLNQVTGIETNNNIQLEITRIYNNSRPLLMTQSVSNRPGVPTIKDIIIGKIDPSFSDYFNLTGLEGVNYQELLDSKDTQKLGILSIKSNFPSFFIQNLLADEIFVKPMLEIETKKYFTSKNHFEYSLSPITDGQNDNHLDEDSISKSVLLLLYNVIKYNDGVFYHSRLKISSEFEALGNYLTSADGVELYEELNQFDIDHLSEDEDKQNDLISLVSIYFETNKDLVIQNKNHFENCLLDSVPFSESNLTIVEKLFEEL